MKKYYVLIVLLVLFYPLTMYCQLQIDAGEFAVVCLDEWGITPDTIGGNPTVLNGSGKYCYTWETQLEINSLGLSFKYSASDFLDDTTKANPIIVNPAPDTEESKIVKFYLNVYDSVTTELARDSMNVFFLILKNNLPVYLGNFVKLN